MVYYPLLVLAEAARLAFEGFVLSEAPKEDVSTSGKKTDSNVASTRLNLDELNKSRVEKGLAPFATQEDAIRALNQDNTTKLKFEAAQTPEESKTLAA